MIKESSSDQASGLRNMSLAKKTKVLAVTGGKGGVGKTSVSLNTAISIAQTGKSVLVLDADLGLANCDVMLGLRVQKNLSHVLSGEAELDFEKGYRINLDGTRLLLEAIRLASGTAPYCPRLVFTSSIAVFGEPLPAVIGDQHEHTPLNSYGTQKAITELLLADYTRKGIFDGIGLRLPTICVRPGKPNKAASGFFSNILREPLSGQEAVLPVDETVRHWFASPRSAVGFFVHAARIDTSLIGARRTLTMPGLSALVGEEIASLRRVAGEKAARLIRHEPDPVIQKIVAGWPRNFDARRATELGFRAETTFDDIIRIHIEDELEGTHA